MMDSNLSAAAETNGDKNNNHLRNLNQSEYVYLFSLLLSLIFPVVVSNDCPVFSNIIKAFLSSYLLLSRFYSILDHSL